MQNKLEIRKVLEATEIELDAEFSYKKLTSGHINQTYLVNNIDERLILQKLNPKVFTDLDLISRNILNLAEHLKHRKYPYKVLQLLPFSNRSYLYNSQWRIFKFIENTQSFLKVQSVKQAYEAAKFLSSFHANLADLPLDKIQDSIIGFLDFEMRWQQYQEAVQNSTKSRLNKAENAIRYLNENSNVLDNWLNLLPQIPIRIIHADPKISNFLFDEKDPNKILALIDWDTLMRGSILYDFGDMVRSYTNLKDEDNPEFGNNFSSENYHALEEGFLFHLKDKLTSLEIKNLGLGAKVVIYIQAMRFLTDYLNGDIYYSTQRLAQNLDRTKNQINLLREIEQKIV